MNDAQDSTNARKPAGNQRDQTPGNLIASAYGGYRPGPRTDAQPVQAPTTKADAVRSTAVFNFALYLVLGMVMAACSLNGVAQPQTPTATEKAPSKTHSLAIVGYNYTDRYIDSFSVNGQGGGNLDISTPTAGGGSSMCCVNWRDGSTLPKKVTVLWVAAYCMQRRTNSDGETKDWREPLWKTADVYFNGPVPSNPQNFEVHFYRDDRIEVALTEGYSPPRLKLPAPPNGYIRPGAVVNDPPCPKDYDRAFSSNKATKVNATGATQP